MKSILYHNYEPNSDLTETSDDITCFLDNIKYTIGNNILLVGDIGNLGNRLRMLGVSVTILENTCYEDICYSLIQNVNCNVVKGSLEFLPFEDKYFDKVIILDHFNHTTDCERVISEINRVLKLDGEVVLEDLNLKNIKVKLKNLKHRLCGENINYHYPNEIIDLFSKVNIKGIMKEIENERYIYIGKRNR
nr:methyltransferase domain-containing protein [uncultured Romboutsia sp.]